MLLRIHNLKKGKLAQRLDDAASAELCLAIIAEYLSEFAANDGEAIKSFKTPKQASLACDLLNIYNSQIGRLLSLFKHKSTQKEEATPTISPKTEAIQEANNVDGTILGIGSAAVIGGLMTNPLLGVPLALAGGLLASKWARPSEEPHQETAVPDTANVSEVGLGFNTKFFLDGLESLFNSIDAIAERFEEPVVVAQPKNPDLEVDLLRTTEATAEETVGKGATPKSRSRSRKPK